VWCRLGRRKKEGTSCVQKGVGDRSSSVSPMGRTRIMRICEIQRRASSSPLSRSHITRSRTQSLASLHQDNNNNLSTTLFDFCNFSSYYTFPVPFLKVRQTVRHFQLLGLLGKAFVN